MNDLPEEELNDETMDRLLENVYRLTGITIGKNRKAMLQGRLRPRMRKLNIQKYHDYVVYLESNPDEIPFFIDLVTTNETYFYRTPRIWEYFSKYFLLEWHLKKLGRPLRIWSAAASSGEEAYTIAIQCQEFKDRNPAFQYQIVGTDISLKVLSIAQAARYSGRSIESFKNGQPDVFQKYLKSDGDSFQVISEIRSRVQFKRHNIFELLKGHEPFDIVFLRNVLIYFNSSDQEKVLRKIRKAINLEGILIIGESESLNRIKVSFSYKEPLIYRASKDIV